MRRLRKGARVRLNREGRKVAGRAKYKDRIGVIFAEPRRSSKNWPTAAVLWEWPTAAVLWEGYKTPQYWAVDFLRKVHTDANK